MVEKWDYCHERLEEVIRRRRPMVAGGKGGGGAGGDSDEEVYQQLAASSSSANDRSRRRTLQQHRDREVRRNKYEREKSSCTSLNKWKADRVILESCSRNYEMSAWRNVALLWS